MKIVIGKPVNFIGPYQVADWLQKVGVSEDKCFDLGTKLSNTWFGKLLTALNERKKQKISITIDKWDTWSADHTIALIAVPLLKQLMAAKHGAPTVEAEDVPQHLQVSAVKDNGDVNDVHFQRWDWVMEEMIWALSQIVDVDSDNQFYTHPEIKDGDVLVGINQIQIDREGLEKHDKRISNGLRLFGKYFRCLWD